MKATRLLAVSPALLILGVVCAFQAFHGKTLFGFGYPLSQNWIDISVKAVGAWVVCGFVLLLGSTVTYLWGLVAFMRNR